MSTNKLTPFTFATIPTKLGREMNLFHARNCEKLARIMERLPREKHDQGELCNVDVQTGCGTSGCALGWAAMSGKFPGLQYGLSRDALGKPTGYAFPVINARRNIWDTAGSSFFGRKATNEIFASPILTRGTIVQRLKAEAKRLRSLR